MKSISSIRGFFQDAIYANSPDFYARISQPVIYRDRSYEEDLRLIGTSEQVETVTGLYFFHEDWQTDRRSNSGTNYPSSNSLIYYTPIDTSIFQRNTDIAAYSEFKIHITSKLTGTIGVRADYQEHSNEQALYSLLPGAVPGSSPAAISTQRLYIASLGGYPDIATLLGAPAGPLMWTSGNVKTNYFKILPKAVLEYEVAPNVRPYVSVSQGQKDGGYDFRAVLPQAQLQSQIPYNPETVTTVEAGVKSKLFDEKLRLNAAVFYNDILGLQATFLDPTTNLSHRFNIGNAHTTGIEGEAIGTLVPGWEIRVALSGLNAQLDSYNGHLLPPTTIGNGYTIHTTPYPGAQLPWAPHFQGSVGTSYILPVHMPGTWRVFADATFQSAEYGDLTNIAQQQIPGGIVINGGVRYTSESGRWNATFTVRNLTDHRYPNQITYTAITSGVNAGKPAYVSTIYSDPTTAFFVLSYSL